MQFCSYSNIINLASYATILAFLAVDAQVNELSPLIIFILNYLLFNLAITSAVSCFNLFTNTKKPINIKSFSISLLNILGTLSLSIGLYPIPRTLRPYIVYLFKIYSNSSGIVSALEIRFSFSGDPFTKLSV
jgi:hypothetical protein